MIPTNCSTPGFPVLHYLLGFAETPAAPFTSLPFIFRGKSSFSNPQLWCPGTLSASILQLMLFLFSPARSITTHVCHWWSGNRLSSGWTHSTGAWVGKQDISWPSGSTQPHSWVLLCLAATRHNLPQVWSWTPYRPLCLNRPLSQLV